MTNQQAYRDESEFRRAQREAKCQRAEKLFLEGETPTRACRRAGVSLSTWRRWRGDA